MTPTHSSRPSAFAALLALVALVFASRAAAQTPVPLGAGSYASEVPVSEYYTDSYFGLPAAQIEPLTAEPALFNSLHLDPALAGRPIPTNQWWTDLLAGNRSYLPGGQEAHVMQQDPYGGNLWAYPGMVAPRSYGLDVYFPNAWKPANANGSPQGGFERGPALQIRSDRGFSIPPEDVVLADFEGPGYPAGWTVTTFPGYTSAFPGSPAQATWTGQSPTPNGYLGNGYINTFLTASGSGGDNRRGILTSPAFTIQKNYLHALVGGGTDVANTVLRLNVAGSTVATAVGTQSGTLRWSSWNVGAYLGQSATIEIVDTSSGGWGFIMCDQLVMSDAANPVGRYGRDMTATSSVVTGWGDWNVDFKLPDAAGNVVGVTLARGVPFTWTTWSGGVKPRLLTGSTTFYDTAGAPIATGSGSFTASAFAFDFQGRTFGVFLPDATVVTVSGSGASTELMPQLSGAENYMVIGYLPAASHLASYAAVAFARPTNSQLSWSHDPVLGVVNTTWTLTTTPLKGTNLDTIQGWLPHHWRTTTHSLAFTPQTYLTPRGVMKCTTGRVFSLAFPFKGFAPVLPAPAAGAAVNPYQPARMSNYMTQFSPGSMIGATYWAAKALAFCAEQMTRAQQLGDTTNYVRLKNALRTAMANWMTYTPGESNGFFTVYPNWKAFIGFDASYGSQAFNDLHFHYGYFAVAGAMLGMVDPQFLTDYGPMLRNVVKCYGNWDRADLSSPFLRTFDVWAGHSNAGGLSSGNGNNQESSSEAMQSWGGMFLLGKMMGDDGMAGAGAMGYAMESCAVNEYWQDLYETNFPPGYTREGTGILFADSIAYGTYFSGDPAWVYGIQYAPANHWLNYMTRTQPAVVAAKYQAMWNERLDWCHRQTLWSATGTYAQGAWVQWNDRIYSASTAVAPGGLEPGMPGAPWSRQADCSRGEPDVLGESPGHIVMCYATLWDHETTAAQFDNYFAAGANIATGGQAVSTYYLIHALRTLGDQDFSYTTSLPTSAVYWNATTSTRTYVVHNPHATTQTVTVYQNGTPTGTMTVPARVTVSTQNVNFTATAPPVPANVSAVSSPAQATLQWTGSTLATSYIVRRATDAGGPFSVLATAEAATFTDTGLTPGATYFYTISAANSVGESAESAVLAATIVPATPTGLAGSLSNGSPVLTWNVVTGATSYKLRRANSLNGTYTVVGTPATTTFTDTTTSTGSTYYYTIAATNSGGDSAASSAVSVTTITPPGVPTNFAAALGTGGVALTWTAPGGGPTGYVVKRALSASGPFTVLGTSATNSFTDTTGDGGLTYYYTVAATNAGGEGAASAVASTTILAVPAASVNCGGAASGQFAADSGFAGGTATTTSAAVDTTGLVNPAPQSVYKSNRFGNHTYTLSGLTAGATYNARLHFSEGYWSAAGQRVFHININGTRVLTGFDILATAGAKNKAVIREFTANANSSGQLVFQFITATDNAQCNGIEIRIPRPVAPTNLAATGGNGQIALTWTTSPDATSYVVKRATSAAGPFTQVAAANAASFTDTALPSGAAYHYTVSAINAGGESPDSTAATASTNPATTFASWQQQHFTPAQLANPLISAANADANGDGLANLLAYAFAQSPWTQLQLPTASVQSGYLAITFTRRKPPTDVTYAVQVSTDLQTWQPATTETAIVPLDAATEAVAIRDNLPMSGETKRFIRVRVSP